MVGLLVDRVFGIKTLQGMIEMHGCQQFPGLFKPGFQLGQRFGDSQIFRWGKLIVLLCHTIAPLAESLGIRTISDKRYEVSEVSPSAVTGMTPMKNLSPSHEAAELCKRPNHRECSFTYYS